MSHEIFKAQIPSAQDFHSVTELSNYVDRRKVLKVGLLTSLVNPVENTHKQRSFIYDTESATGQLPNSKTYSSRGDYLTQDTSNDKTFAIPSMGYQSSIQIEDYADKRIPGTTEFQDEAYVAAKLAMKHDDGWDLHKEYGIANLITTDTNYVGSNAIGTVYNFYTTIEGSARPAATDVLFGTSANPIATLRNAKKQLLQYASKNSLSGRPVIVAGDTFFNSRLQIEANAGLGRPIVLSKDLAQEEVGNLTNNSWNYDMFVGGLDGILYINYGSEIFAGTNLIADNMGYLILAGSDAFSIEYAPARHRDHVNKDAQTMYRWTYTDPFNGDVRLITESNRLFMNRKPGAVIPLTSSN